ncbi:MAG: hypothetical protein ACTHJQ_25315 [Rhizobiaceae bacterium]
MTRYILVSLVSAYLGAGLFAGLLYQRAIPAINPLGVALIAVTWPNQIRCARVSSGCKPVPAWASPYIFTFQEPTHGN